MLNLLDGGVNQMITHLEEVTKKDRVVVNIKDVFQKMTLDVIARSVLLHKIINYVKCLQMCLWHRF